MIPLEELVRRAIEGDRRALESAIGAVQHRVYRLALRLLGDPADAEDATQDVLVRVVTNLGSYRGEAAFTTWVYRVATNHLLNVRRGRAEEQASFHKLGEQIDVGAKEGGDSSHDRLLKREVVLGCTQAMLMCLDREHRIALVLGDIFDLSHEEGAFVLDIEPAAYRKRLERARERVHAFLRGRCGVFDATAPCRCGKQVAYAARIGALRPEALRFATLLEEGHSPDFEELVNVASIRHMYQSQPKPRAPDTVLAELRRVIGGRQ